MNRINFAWHAFLAVGNGTVRWNGTWNRDLVLGLQSKGFARSDVTATMRDMVAGVHR